jgi:hypothetical protein
MGVCLAENSLMMVMENWGKSKQVLRADVGRWILDVGGQNGGLLVGSSWGALRSTADFRRSMTILAVP